MRVVLFLALALAGCYGSSTPAPVTTTPVVGAPIANLEPTCTDASIGIDRGTKDLRPPDTTIGEPMRAQCLSAPWSQVAITCFAKMRTAELGDCVKHLDDKQRDAVLAALGGTDEATVAITLVKLGTLKVGIAECDSFIGTVSVVLGCDAMPIETRVQLGLETSDAWSLPTKNLRADMAARMSKVCKQSLEALIDQSKTYGCL